MKKKLALILALVFVVAVFGTVLAACSTLSDGSLTELLRDVRRYHNSDATVTLKDYTLIGKVSTFTDEGDVEAYVSWTSSSDKVIISKEMNDAGFYTVTVPTLSERAALTQDLSYTLTATLTNKRGKAYTNEDGETYTVTFDRKVTTIGSYAKITFDSVTKVTDKGAEYRDSYNNVGYEYVIWEENDISVNTIRNTSTSGSTISYKDPARFYAQSKLEISYPRAIKAIRIAFDSSYDTKHNTGLDGTTGYNRVGDVGLLVLATPTTTWTSGPLSNQTRVKTIEIYTEGAQIPTLEEFVKPETEQDILAALDELQPGEKLLEGPYSLTGTIKEFKSEYSDQYNNAEVILTVGGKDILCFRLKGGSNIEVGETITVTGELENYQGTIQFSSGCTYKRADFEDKKLENITTVTAGTYKLGMYQKNLNKWLYFNGYMSGNFFDATDDYELAADVQLEQVTDGWTMKIVGGYNDGQYLSMNRRSSSTAASPSADLSLSAADTATVWKWSDELKAFYVVIDGTNFYLGTYNTFETFSASKESYFTQTNPNFLGYLGSIVAAED